MPQVVDVDILYARLRRRPDPGPAAGVGPCAPKAVLLAPSAAVWASSDSLDQKTSRSLVSKETFGSYELPLCRRLWFCGSVPNRSP